MSGGVDQEPEDGEAAQLDVVTSFLAIVLIYLVTMVMLTSNAGEGTMDSTYRREDPEGPAAVLRSYQSIYPFQERWLVQDGRVARLDLKQLAAAIAAAPLDRTDFLYPDGTRITMEPPADGSLTGFVMKVLRPYKDGPPAVATAPFDVVMTLQEAIAAIPGAFQPGAYFFVHPIATRDSAAFLGALQQSGLNPQIAVTADRCGDSWCPGIRRDADSFALEAIFR